MFRFVILKYILCFWIVRSCQWIRTIFILRYLHNLNVLCQYQIMGSCIPTDNSESSWGSVWTHIINEIIAKFKYLAKMSIPTWTDNIDWKEFVCGWGAAFCNITISYPMNKIIFRQVIELNLFAFWKLFFKCIFLESYGHKSKKLNSDICENFEFAGWGDFDLPPF